MLKENRVFSVLFKAYNYLVVFAILFVINGCQKVDLNKINNLNGNKIDVIGHGGIGFESPQNPLPHNSFSSLTKAVDAYGVEGIEMDLKLSADGVLFLYHDNSLETLTDCAGCVLFEESEVLKNCRYRSSLRSNLFLNEKISTLEAVLEHFSQRPIKPKMILDIKPALPSCGDFDYDVYRQRFVDELARLLVKYDALDWCFVEAEKIDFLIALKEILPTVKLSFIPVLQSEEEIIDAAEKGFYMISLDNDLISAEYAQFIHDNGLRVAIYGVKIKSAAIDAINKSPDFIYTDNIILLQEILN